MAPECSDLSLPALLSVSGYLFIIFQVNPLLKRLTFCIYFLKSYSNVFLFWFTHFQHCFI